ncbi:MULTISPECIES: cardiolipin synthase [Ralstonia solanacearum species complex]|uniref:cardiolipin synthase n=1 Tax=Ralstonia solanacearum species complex TaxID=3116862 RepID=UPI00078DCE53|nr:cardiolipin synthase [Ralstonia solanacearum]BEU74754.1 cardiolipin synthase [Ralstonia pseudosolanacearum]AMP40165.1 cardiolipin synthase [Ralstonia solanacearum]AXV79578.1 cardiolipin synthase [Ralstonia solanacearum]AXV89016.1 cardiolipin synthase [Ralstonia solanacearum]AXV93605.1 cardiolipin synthase [Ralstonia solanacearum]
MPTSTTAFAAFLFLVHCVGVLAAGHAVLTVRTSPGAIAWAISLITLPEFTLIPYLIFGRSSFAGYVDARRFHNARLREITLSDDWRRLRDHESAVVAPQHACMQALPRLTGMPCLSRNRVRLLVNGAETFEAIFAAIREARRVLIVQFFIVHDDALGRRLAEALLERARAGVRVYFLFDRIGCHALPRHYVRQLEAGGVMARPFSTHAGFVNRFQLNFRNHRKLVVVDGERAYVGGHNVGTEYLGEHPPLAPWRDTHIEIVGAAVMDLQLTFAEDWYWAAHEVPQLIVPKLRPDEDMVCQVVASGPADPQETCSLFFVEAIQSARKRLWITTPYFIPDEAVFAALRLAVLRGVDVRILIPARPDHYVVFHASTLYAYQAIRAGVKIYRYQPGFLHQKVVLIDGEAAAVGTANLDNRSFRLNFELMVVTADTRFANDVAQMLEADFAEAARIGRDEYERAPPVRRVIMHVAKLFAPIL